MAIKFTSIPIIWQAPLIVNRYLVLRLRLLSFFSLQDNKRMKSSLEEEQKARKELEKIVRRVLKNMNDPSWDETNL